MRILVLGAGAVGGYFGGRLIEAGGDVTFLAREARAAHLAANGLVITSPHGDAAFPVRALTVGSPPEPYDIVLLACKAYDLASAIDSIEPFVGPGSHILPLLNGINHLDRIDARFGRKRVLGGIVQIGATVSAGGAIEHFNRIHRMIVGHRDGETSPRTKALASLMARAKFDSGLSEMIMQDMWEKFVSLGTQAGMTCLMRAPPGSIMKANEGEALMLEFLAECATVATAAGFAPRLEVLERARTFLTAKDSTFTASMLRDINRAGPTEGAHVLGDMLRRARELGVPTPLLRVANCHVECYEVMRGARA